MSRIRDRLADLLAVEGFKVHPDDLRPVQGRERSDFRFDIYRWTGHGVAINHPKFSYSHVNVSFESWSTMTDCVRYGITVGKGEGGNTDFCIFAKQQSEATKARRRSF